LPVSFPVQIIYRIAFTADGVCQTKRISFLTRRIKAINENSRRRIYNVRVYTLCHFVASIYRQYRRPRTRRRRSQV